VANNGEECLNALGESLDAFDIVLMDCQMPGTFVENSSTTHTLSSDTCLWGVALCQ
jgi:CheY-like chemotaxis protein